MDSPIPPPEPVAAALADVKARIAEAAKDVGRNPLDVTLAAVSKQQPGDRLEAALAAGQRVFAENRVQEAQQHWAQRRERWSDLTLRLIGPLQSNKVRDAVGLFDAIETLDREKLARALADEFARTGTPRILLVQVNTGAEPQKAGVLPSMADRFIETVQREYGLVVSGLMCIPPLAEDPTPHFQHLAALAARNGLATLSMGMSNDYAVAVRCGATIVRVGSAIFGAR